MTWLKEQVLHRWWRRYCNVRLNTVPAEAEGVLPAAMEHTSPAPTPYARLVRLSPVDTAPWEIVLTQVDILIGRGQDCDVIIPHASVSRAHARMKWSKQGYVLFDLQSKTGTYVNGRRIGENLLKKGWVVRIGAAEFFVYEAYPHA